MEKPRIVIERRRGLGRYQFSELVRYRDLLYFMVLRDITVLYKQSVLGLAWAFINPIVSVLIFSVVFGTLAGVPSDGIPYPIFSCAAILPWNYFANTLNASGTSLITNTSIFTKVYFPRLIIPLVPVFSKFVDLLISFLLLVALMFYYECYPTVKLLALPVLVLLMMMATAGLGMWLSALAIQYRDVKFGLTFVVPLMMYAAPVVFPASLILEKFGEIFFYAYHLYPMVGVIEGFRAAVIPQQVFVWPAIAMSGCGAAALFTIGLMVFRKLESRFADVA
jgi:lipopolysaccharide transport system permease protein